MSVADDLDGMIARGVEPALAVAAITVEQAAKLLAIHSNTVRRWVHSGALPAYPQRYHAGKTRWMLPLWGILAFQKVRCEVVMAAAQAGKRIPKKLPK